MAWSIWLSTSESSVNNTNNTSVLTATLNIEWDYGSWAADWPDYSITIDGTSYSGSANFNTGGAGSGSQAVASHSKTITHNSDGSKYVYCSAWYDGTGSGRKSCDTSRTLTTIPRAASISSASNKTLGEYCSIAWTPKVSSHRYKIKFSLGSWNYTTGYISPNRTTSYTYTGYQLPIEAICRQLPNSTSGTMSATLYTYSNTTQIGSPSSKTFTVYVPSNIVPSMSSVSIALDNSANATVDSWGIWVQNFSKAVMSASATSMYGATIKSFKITGGLSTTVNSSSLTNYNLGTVTSYGTKSFSVVAVDSRGRQSSAMTTSDITIYEYSPPTIDAFVVSRTENNPSLVSSFPIFNYSTVNGNNHINAFVKYKPKNESAYSTATKEVSSNTSNIIADLPNNNIMFNQLLSYNVMLVVTDTIGNSATSTGKIDTVKMFMHWREGGKGIGFGKAAESDSMEVDMPAIFFQDIVCKDTISIEDEFGNIHNILELLYPIGSIYMSTINTDPAFIFGGTWRQITDRFLIGAKDIYTSAGSYNIGATGGAATHTLTTTEMPSHSHVVGSRCGYLEGGSGFTGPVLDSYGQLSSMSTNSSGGNGSHNNMPPYKAVYMWERISPVT